MSSRPSIAFDGIYFEETPEGFIHCQEDEGSDWCQHIALMIRAGADAEMLWQRRDINLADSDEVEIQIAVPLVPTLHCWVPVTLEVTSIPNTRKLSVDEFAGKDYPMVGYVHPGEGRDSFRNMIWQWFLGVAGENQTCQNSSHGFREEVQWAEAVREKNASWMYHRWYLFATDGICAFCDARNVDFSDLVPESEHETYSGRVGGF